VRVLLYLLFTVGGGLILVALAIVMMREDGTFPVAPQSQKLDISRAQPVPEPKATDSQILLKEQKSQSLPNADALAIDVARVKPDGSAVIAGTAAPNARVRIAEGKVLLGETVANEAGEWVLVLEKPLAPGQHLITITMELGGGTKGLADINLAVEIYPDQKSRALVAFLPESSSDAPVLMQSPDDNLVITTGTSSPTDVSHSRAAEARDELADSGSASADKDIVVASSNIESSAVALSGPEITNSENSAAQSKNALSADKASSVEPKVSQAPLGEILAAETTNGVGSNAYGASATASHGLARSSSASVVAKILPTAIVWLDAGKVLISGMSAGGVRVKVAVDQGFLGEALVLASGEWQIAGSLNMDKVSHNMIFRLIDASDVVVSRYELPVKSRDLAKGMDGTPLVVVNKGDALWRIAYRRLGEGIRYVDIVRRNSREISDPDLIYPKQIFAVPK
jgi:nucleoid-associated protein YgaU